MTTQPAASETGQVSDTNDHHARAAYNALNAMFGGMTPNQAFNVVAEHRNTWCTRAYMAWHSLYDAFGPAKYDPLPATPPPAAPPAELPGLEHGPFAVMAGAPWNVLDSRGCRIALCGGDSNKDWERFGPPIAAAIVEALNKLTAPADAELAAEVERLRAQNADLKIRNRVLRGRGDIPLQQRDDYGVIDRHLAQLTADNERLRAELQLWKPMTAEEADAAFDAVKSDQIDDATIERIVSQVTDPTYRPTEPEHVLLVAKVAQLRAERDEAREHLAAAERDRDDARQLLATEILEWAELDNVLDAVPGIVIDLDGYRVPTIEKLKWVIERLAAANERLAVMERRDKIIDNSWGKLWYQIQQLEPHFGEDGRPKADKHGNWRLDEIGKSVKAIVAIGHATADQLAALAPASDRETQEKQA